MCEQQPLQSNLNYYKYCFVPTCKNTSSSTPNKDFVFVPSGSKRKAWFQAVGYSDVTTKRPSFCCEDHFNLPDDMENYMEYKLVRARKKIKQDVLPRFKLNAFVSISDFHQRADESDKTNRLDNHLVNFEEMPDICLQPKDITEFATDHDCVKNVACTMSSAHCENSFQSDLQTKSVFPKAEKVQFKNKRIGVTPKVFVKSSQTDKVVTKSMQVQATTCNKDISLQCKLLLQNFTKSRINVNFPHEDAIVNMTSDSISSSILDSSSFVPSSNKMSVDSDEKK